MAVINKANVPPPSVPKQVVENVEGLGGDVIVRGLYLSERTTLLATMQGQRISLSDMLAFSVIDENGDAVYSSEEWEKYGAAHYAQALELFNVARKLSGFDQATNEKKP